MIRLQLPTTTEAEVARLLEASSSHRRLVSSIKLRWEVDGCPDALAALQAYPELNRSKTLALELAYEEFCQRLAAGEDLDPDTFCDKFAGFRHTLRRLLSIHNLLEPAVAAAARKRPALGPGECFLDFQILEELGKGAFATVYLARQLSLGKRLVAIKVAVDAGDEASILGKLTHPNIVPVHSVEIDDASGCSVICMPYLGRATLADALDYVFAGAKPRPHAAAFWEASQGDQASPRSLGERAPVAVRGSYLDAVVRIGVQLADALAHAHSQGIVHRDLKPSNVLLAFDARPMILDFNLSSDREIELLHIGGTLPYMAPEQLEAVVSGDADPSSVDAPADIFSIGAILYELLCGKPPFRADSRPLGASNLAEHLQARRDWTVGILQEAAVAAGDAVLGIIGRCLSFDPADRPRSAIELRTLLSQQLSRRKRWQRWRASHPRFVLSLGSVDLAASLVLGIALATREPYAVRQLKVASREIEAGELAQATETLNGILARDPDFVDAYVARARLHCRTGQMALAFDDYNAAYARHHSPQLAACKAYCTALIGHHGAAVELYSEAMQHGVHTPVVLNNLGWSLFKLGRLAEARTKLSEAITAAPDFQPAWVNRAVVSLQEFLATGKLASEGLTDFTQAIALGPASGEIYGNLAVVYARKARTDHGFGPQVTKYLALAIENGYDPAKISSEPCFARISTVVDFGPLLRQPRANPQRMYAVHMVNPDAPAPADGRR